VERLAKLGAELRRSELYVKRDDRTNAEYGGNKPRKLAWLLADAIQRGRRTIVTAGALGSHHAIATSLFARQLGLEVCALLTPQPLSPEVRAGLASHAVLETELHLVRFAADLPFAIARTMAAKTAFLDRPALIVPGGSSPVGVLGYVDAGLEFAAQVREGACPSPTAVVVPCGTGGTAAGLALGFALAGLAAPVVAVRVVPKSWMPAILPAAIAHATAALLARHGLPSALRAATRLNLRVDDRWLGEGYGHPTSAGAEALARFAAQERLALDPTYTAKAAAAFLDLVSRAERPDDSFVFWLTLSAAPPPGAAAGPNAYLGLPPEFHKFFREPRPRTQRWPRPARWFSRRD
jgi:1-aminocyclopropane-1-carboxylate deaminase/D-cysteine desulfhydrase-like pyridoxal-dependent ACC family enzyme